MTKVKLLAMDVDGTLTDAMLYYASDGSVMKKFYMRDGMGIELMHHNGLIPAIITSETSEIVEKRAKKLRIQHLIMGSRNKTNDLQSLAQKLCVPLDETAYIGDDVNDYHVMQIVGCSACPADAVEAVKGVADCICERNGGHGAVREFIELILLSQNKSFVLPENW